MNLTVLGRSGPWPEAGGACSGYLLEANGVKLLLDCGCGVLGKLQQHCRIEELDGVVLTHLHTDHMGDMTVLRYALPRLLGPTGKLPVFMPAVPEREAGYISGEPCFAVTAISGGESISFKGLEISFSPVRHLVPCNAVRIAAAGKTIVYSGDLNTTQGFAGFARGADLLLIDSHFTNAEWNETLPHLSAALAAREGAEAGVRRLLHTHLRPGTDEAKLLEESRREFPQADVAQLAATYHL